MKNKDEWREKEERREEKKDQVGDRKEGRKDRGGVRSRSLFRH